MQADTEQRLFFKAKRVPLCLATLLFFTFWQKAMIAYCVCCGLYNGGNV